MKKIFIALALLAVVACGYAQPRAIGARLGGDLEFSYQHALGNNMLDCTAGLGIGSQYFTLNATVVYDWVFNIKGGWNWYVGPGAGLGVGFYSNAYETPKIPLRLAIGGQIGVEYQFGIPLNISLDYRPMFNVFGLANGYDYGSFFAIALGLRYRF